MLSRNDSIKHSDTHYSLGKYQIYYARSEFDGTHMWEIQYKDFWGENGDFTSLDEAVDSILAEEKRMHWVYGSGPGTLDG